MRYRSIILILVLFCSLTLEAQEITQYDVFAGRYDYTAFGNTMNLVENGTGAPCEILTSSSATLTLEADQTVRAAYLYWAGSGTGDFEVTLNNSTLVAQRTFADEIDADRPFFAAFADITAIIEELGAIEYTLSNLDVSDVIPTYCASGTNFAGWAITVIYEDSDLPLNQVNVFDGLESVSATQNDLVITLENLNVLDNNNAKIGFIAWEGDEGLAIDETLSINGNILSNPPLNPANNQFNGTNSFTNEDMLFNMDIDFYGIENNIEVGDTQAVIQLTSGQDFVMINNIITVLNSQLPDGIVAIDDIETSCNSRSLTIDYTITNQGTEVLPVGTPIAFYADAVFTGASVTEITLAPGATSLQTSMITIDDTVLDNFELVIIIDDDGTGNGTVIESNEDNNSSTPLQINLVIFEILELEPLFACDADGDGVEIFDLDEVALAAGQGQEPFSYEIYLSLGDATSQTNPISGVDFQNTTDPQEIFFRFESDVDPDCVVISQTTVNVIAAPIIPPLQDLFICDDASNDGVEVFDLTIENELITNGVPDLSVSFFVSQQDAENNENQISNPESFTNAVNPQEVYTLLINTNAPECVAIASFLIEVTPINDILSLPALVACNEGFEIATFDLTAVEDGISLEEGEEVTGYYTNEIDAFNEENAISDPFEYVSLSNPQTIFVRTDDTLDINCYELSQFQLMTENCPPFVPEGFSPSGDGINDTFEISGLKDIFTDYQLHIYSRLGNLVYEGDNAVPFWDGTPNAGLGGTENPTGVYYWVLYLNDPNVSDMTGWVYLNR